MNDIQEEQIAQITKLLEEHMKYWNGIIQNLSGKLRSLDTLAELESEVLVKKDEASQYFTDYSIILAKKIREYKIKLGETSYKYKTSPENIMKMRTDSFITSQVEKDLAFEKYVIDVLEAHVEHMKNIVRSITDMIYLIQNRIRIEELSKGLYR